MSRIDDVFAELRRQDRKAFIPFVTAGDPSLAATAAVVRTLAESGASLCEIGVPYSDPIADGPVIQASYTRALDKKLKLSQIFDSMRPVAQEVATPLATMLSFATVHRLGPSEYIKQAQAAGFAGAIVPDLPIEESGKLAELCRAADFSLIQLVTPTTPRERAVRIAEGSSGFVYFVSVTGITGERRELSPELLESVAWLKERTPLPVCIGFGVSTPEHVRTLAPVADGVIVGSAFVRRLAEATENDLPAKLDEIGAFAQTLTDALQS